MRTAITSQVLSLALGKTAETVRRKVAALKRGRGPRRVHYFHRVDDPMCQLLVQVLPELKQRFEITLVPHVVEQLDAPFFPAPERYEAHSILDAGRVASLYGLGFPSGARVPDRLGVGMASRFLASIEEAESFFESATEIGEALWRYDIAAVRRLSGMADLGDDRIKENEQLLRDLGHWESGTLIYEGEHYRGVPRLDYLEDRLNHEGAGDGQTRFNLGRDLFALLDGNTGALEGKTLQMYWSGRSPYSYIALERAARFSARVGLQLDVLPILPMVTRGLPLPSVKKFAIARDAAREARAYDIPFGRIADPLGRPIEQGLSLAFALKEEGLDLPFLRSWARHTWSRGNNGGTRPGLAAILATAGLSGRAVSPLDSASWRSLADKNRDDLALIGGWGVPTFKVGHQMFWGQDRLWAAIKALAESP